MIIQFYKSLTYVQDIKSSDCRSPIDGLRALDSQNNSSTLLPDEVEHGRSCEKSEANHKKGADSAAVCSGGVRIRDRQECVK